MEQHQCRALAGHDVAAAVGGGDERLRDRALGSQLAEARPEHEAALDIAGNETMMFKGDREALQTVMDAVPEVLNHNTETVLRLQRDIRTSASYGRSLALLWRAKQMNPHGLTKSGLIVGMGETQVGKRPDATTNSLHLEAIKACLTPISQTEAVPVREALGRILRLDR